MHPISPQTLTADEVAAVLGISPAYFRQKRPALERAGFPRRLPTLVGRWSRIAVEGWIASNGEEDPPPSAPHANVVRIDEARAALEARYGSVG